MTYRRIPTHMDGVIGQWLVGSTLRNLATLSKASTSLSCSWRAGGFRSLQASRQSIAPQRVVQLIELESIEALRLLMDRSCSMVAYSPIERADSGWLHRHKTTY